MNGTRVTTALAEFVHDVRDAPGWCKLASAALLVSVIVLVVSAWAEFYYAEPIAEIDAAVVAPERVQPGRAVGLMVVGEKFATTGGLTVFRWFEEVGTGRQYGHQTVASGGGSLPPGPFNVSSVVVVPAHIPAGLYVLKQRMNYDVRVGVWPVRVKTKRELLVVSESFAVTRTPDVPPEHRDAS